MKRLLLLLLCCSFLFSCTKKLAPYSFTQHPAPVALSPRSVEPPTPVSPVQSFPVTMTPLPVAATPQRLYQAALEEIRQMLTGDRPLDFKRAVFITENAYLDNQLDYTAFCQAIAQLAQASQGLQTKLDLAYTQSDREAVVKNAALFRLMTDTLAVDAQGQTVARQPFRYHLADFSGKQDWSNTFVTKLLATRLGNCHSLPFLYKILAEETGAQAYLSLAPNHIYLQHHNKQTGWYNTELTSGSFPMDAWLMASGYISTQTVVSRIYMDTLSLRQSVAFCLVDLAQGYQRKAGNNQPTFVQQCTHLALQHYPNSIQAQLVKAQALQAQYQQETRPSQKQALKATLTEVCRQIAATGYEEMPTSVYWEWLTSAGKDKYHNQAVPGRPSERNPFTGEPILTLSQGKYPEMHQTKSRVQIGNVVYNVASGRIERFVQPDTSGWAISPEVAARFLSVDPLAQEYPYYTPYQFAGNTPILSTDIDGLEPQWLINVSEKIGHFMIEVKDDAVESGKGAVNLASTFGTGVYNLATVYVPQTFGYNGGEGANLHTTEGTFKWDSPEGNEIVNKGAQKIGTDIVISGGTGIAGKALTPIASPILKKIAQYEIAANILYSGIPIIFKKKLAGDGVNYACDKFAKSFLNSARSGGIEGLESAIVRHLRIDGRPFMFYEGQQIAHTGFHEFVEVTMKNGEAFIFDNVSGKIGVPKNVWWSKFDAVVPQNASATGAQLEKYAQEISKEVF